MNHLLNWLRWLVVWPDRHATDAPARSWGGWLLACVQGLFGVSSWQREDGSWRWFFTWLLRSLQGLAVRVAALLVLLGLGVYLLLWGSLPDLDGTRTVAGLQGEVRIERDGQSIPTIHATSRADLFLGLGYLHAQERYFMMDLSRRFAGGELAELLGPAALRADEFYRHLRLRQTVREFLDTLTPEQKVELDAYVAGINAGLRNLTFSPPEYQILQATPKPWSAEDTGLVLLAVCLMLQDDNWEIEQARAVAHAALPESLYRLLDARGIEKWDAPLQGNGYATPDLPTAEEFDLRKQPARRRERPAIGLLELDRPVNGSNNWAIAGSETRHGKAILANDMHLGLRTPTIWYRAGLAWTGRDGQPRKAWGVTYPGTPGLVVGSNQKVAWGLTNAEVDSADLVRLERDPDNEKLYRVGQEWKEVEVFQETLHVRGAASKTIRVEATKWGPVLPNAPHYSLRWIPQTPGGFNLGWLDLLETNTLDEVLNAANNTAGPHQNFIAVDSEGNIGWTLLGAIPKRVGFDGRLPISWADGTCGWEGFHPPSASPRVVRPANGRLWTANNRVVDGADLTRIGESGFDRGARAQQIRDALLALRQPEEEQVYNIALDHRAVFLSRWKERLLKEIDRVKGGDTAGLAWMRQAVASSSDVAAPSAVGYRLVTEFREEVGRAVLDPLVDRCKTWMPNFDYRFFRQIEGALWKITEERPPHLLSRDYASWDDLFEQAIQRVLTRASQAPGGREAYTWGARNATKIHHPLGDALAGVPQVGGWLAGWVNMPRRELDGAPSDMPRAQAPTHGASQRMVVSPGREEFGSFQIPCGQSGHCLSPHYRDMHDAWCTGERTPFLPGPTAHTLTLKP